MLPFPMWEPPQQQLTMFSVTQGTAVTIAWPANIRKGDLAVLFDDAENTGTTPIPTTVLPTGFTSLADNGMTAVRTRVSYKICDGTESGNITGMTGTSSIQKTLYIVRGTNEISSVVTSTFTSVMDGNDPAAQNTTLVGLQPPVIYFAHGGNRTGPASTFTTESPALDSKVTDIANTTGYKIYNESPANHTVDTADLSTANWLYTGYIRTVD